MPALNLSPGQVLGRYELLLPIARGGMAQVWAARLRGTRGFQKVVAMKTILAGSMDDTRLEQMFLEEASLASQIHHPNVVETLDLGEHDGTLYLVMEWVDGEPLHLIMKEARTAGGIPLPIAVNLIGQACKGLHAAHELRDDQDASRGLVHRDISPQNILVTYSGTVKVVDFGIAKATNRASGLTEEGQVKGKCAFMAPEQMRGQAIDRRADVFSMGIVLYQLTTGQHPFRAEEPAQTIENICAPRPPKPPSELVADYPEGLDAVVMKALEKDPERRWATAHDLLGALEEAVPGCLEASFEREVEQFMKSLLGNLPAQRRSALRHAQARADRMPESGAPGALLLEASGAATGSGRLSNSTGSTPRAWLWDRGASGFGAGTSTAPTAQPEPVQRGRHGILSALAAAGVVSAAVALLVRAPEPPPAPAPAAAAAPIAAPASPQAVTVAAGATPVSQIPTDVPAVAAPEISAAIEQPARRGTRVARNVARHAVEPAPRAVPTATAEAPPAPSTTSGATSGAKPAPDAWNADAFGGRH